MYDRIKDELEKVFDGSGRGISDMLSRHLVYGTV
jgi:hypothetical protein